MLVKPTISLHGNVETVTLGNRDNGSFILAQGATGLGWGPHELTSVALAGGGSVLRHRRLTEADVMIPIVLSADDFYQRRDDRRTLEQLCANRVEIRINHPDGWSRSRWGYLKDGLEGAYGVGEDSHNGQKLVLTFLCPDPWWYGQERILSQKVDAARKPFITKALDPISDGAVVHREDRAPASSDAGTMGDVWFEGENAEPEKVLRRNLVKNPSFETDVSGWVGGAGSAVVRDTESASLMGGVVGSAMAKMTSSAAAGTGVSVSMTQNTGEIPLTPGEWIALGLWAATEQTGETAAPQINLRATSGISYPKTINTAPFYIGRRSLVSARVPSDGLEATFSAVMGKSAESTSLGAGKRLWVDGVIAAVADTQSAAEAAVETYFDGDTPAANGKRYRWLTDGTSEEYTPASDFKPSARYVHDGTEWVDMGLERRAPFFPVVLASSTVDGAYQLDIQGDAEAWPIWTVDGPGEDLLIEKVRTGERIFIEGEFGETVTIDTRAGDIYSDTFTRGELWDRVSLDSVLFPLAPGRNRIKITMVNARPNSEVRLRYRETWRAGH